MPDPVPARHGTVLAFDFGEKRIGVAVGEWALRQAHPLTVIRGEANAERFARIAELLREWQPQSLVVGLPLALDGTPHAMTARCTRFANQLRGRFGLPVETAEERLTSVEAEERLREAGLTPAAHATTSTPWPSRSSCNATSNAPPRTLPALEPLSP